MFWIALTAILLSLVFAFYTVKDRCEDFCQGIFMFFLVFIGCVIALAIIGLIISWMHALWLIS